VSRSYTHAYTILNIHSMYYYVISEISPDTTTSNRAPPMSTNRTRRVSRRTKCDVVILLCCTRVVCCTTATVCSRNTLFVSARQQARRVGVNFYVHTFKRHIHVLQNRVNTCTRVYSRDSSSSNKRVDAIVA